MASMEDNGHDASGEEWPTVDEWYVKVCPWKSECSTSSWDRCGVCSQESYEACIDLLDKHLKNSSKHWHHPEEERMEACANAQIDIREAYKKDPNAVKAAPQPKKQKTDGGSVSATRAREMAETAARQAAEAVLAASGGAAGPSTGIVPMDSGTGTLALFSAPETDKVVMTRQTLKCVQEALQRNKRACKAALQFFEAGVTAFKDELKTVDDAMDVLDEAARNATPFRMGDRKPRPSHR